MHTIRQANTNDVEIIRQIADQTWWTTYGPIIAKEQITYMLTLIYAPEKIKEQIEKELQTYLILSEGDEPVAFAGFSPREEDSNIYKLHKLYCLPSTQGKGYGKILIDEVSKMVAEAGKNILDLNVNRYNKAKTFYEKMGFEVIYEEDIPVGPYWMNDYIMRKVIV